MLIKRERLRQRICHIQIRMHFANLHIAFLYVLTYHVEASENVFSGGVSPWLLGVRNGTRIVAEEDHGVLHAREHSKFDDELLDFKRPPLLLLEQQYTQPFIVVSVTMF